MVSLNNLLVNLDLYSPKSGKKSKNLWNHWGFLCWVYLNSSFLSLPHEFHPAGSYLVGMEPFSTSPFRLRSGDIGGYFRSPCQRKHLKEKSRWELITSVTYLFLFPVFHGISVTKNEQAGLKTWMFYSSFSEQHYILSSSQLLLVGAFNRLKEYLWTWESSPNRGENKTYLKPPASLYQGTMLVPILLLFRRHSWLRYSWWCLVASAVFRWTRRRGDPQKMYWYWWD